MPEQTVQRKLTAILYADVVGYSRLTGADELGTHQQLSKALDFISGQITGHGGAVVHYAGDAVLADFSSAVSAVECAIAIQLNLAKDNQDLSAEQRLEFRIGVNLGEVIVDRDDIYGDGVNIAARLESLADSGGILISGVVHDQVSGKLNAGFEFAGDQEVKNISQPVSTYKVVLGGRAQPDKTAKKSSAKLKQRGTGKRSRKIIYGAIATLVILIAGGMFILGPGKQMHFQAVLERMAFPLPEKPSIAVLPFDNLSADAKQDHIADGLTEDIITSLSQIKSLFVIARNSSFSYKGKPTVVQQVAEELGVRYVLEGSVQKSGAKIRITAQLIDALSGTHVWADRFDREQTDLFAMQDEITNKITLALRVTLTDGEEARVHRRHTRSLEAWNVVSLGVEYFNRFTKADNHDARRYFVRATEIDPGYALAYALRAWTHWIDVQNGWGNSREESFAQAEYLSEKAQSLDTQLPDVYALKGAMLLMKKQYDQAIASAERAVALSPNHATNTALLAMILSNSGKPLAAIQKFKTAMRLSPYYADWFLEQLGFAYLAAEQPKEAMVTFEKFLERKPGKEHAAHAHVGRAVAIYHMGHKWRAKKEIEKAVGLGTGISVGHFKQNSVSRDRRRGEEFIKILVELGLPE